MQINPLTAVQGFFISDSQAFTPEQQSIEGQVMGISEAADNEFNQATTSVSESELPVAEIKDTTPIRKLESSDAPEITAKSAVVIDIESDKKLFSKNPDEVSSIASITKLVTALVVLVLEPDFSQEYTIQLEDRREGGRIFLFQGDGVTIEDLFNISLVGSANTATIALVRALEQTEQDFVMKMNAKVEELGLEKTVFVDPIGLSSNNKSTAYEVAKIVEVALTKEEIQEAVVQDKYILKTKQGKTKIIENTDNLLKEKNGYEVLGGKTGYLGSAGFCFAGKFSEDGHEIVSVILGSQGEDSRFTETDELVKWVYESYVWP